MQRTLKQNQYQEEKLIEALEIQHLLEQIPNKYQPMPILLINWFSPIADLYKEIKVEKELEPMILSISQIPIQLGASSLQIEIDLIGKNRTARTSILIDSEATRNFINYWFI